MYFIEPFTKNVGNERKDGAERERERERERQLLYWNKNTNSSSILLYKSGFLIVSSFLCKFELMQIHLSRLSML